MSIANAYFESLPYIDEELSPESRAAAEALIKENLETSSATHPNLPALIPSNPSSILASELARVSTVPPTPLTAIDLSRYEAPSTPPTGASLEESTAILARAYAAHSYMRSRASHLALLDKHGKNAWLIGNWNLEAELKTIENELARVSREVDLLNVARNAAQQEVAAELKMLEDTWQKGIARTIETQVATAQLRAEVLEEMRVRAQ
ncbi:hypothetical protein TD95_002876 [Thielaviopsis punctulata]|uniref:Pre-mRNA-splicing factor SPF27 n=1 Tax=Thielaviopsis punctulata TaxID=72032 RepID=A0A0F4ZDX9_9PEZI|nr:hypothetical protein TD95_002876 [Thielaviopsis punctulata]